MPSTWLTPPQIAAKHGIAVDKVHGWIASGELVACNLAERQDGRPRWRIDPAELAAFLRRRQSRGPAPKQRRKRPRRQEVPQYV